MLTSAVSNIVTSLLRPLGRIRRLAGAVSVLIVVLGLAALLCPDAPRALALGLFAQGEPGTQADNARPREAAIDAAIQRGLRYLSLHQRGDGALASTYPVATTALGGMAFLGAGVEYDRGAWGPVLVKAVAYLLGRADDRGYVHDDEEQKKSRMHGHAYAMLFLAQVAGTIDTSQTEARVREAIQRGIRVIERGQTGRGGWGYEPGDAQDEASITVCCLQALRAAKDAGFLVEDRAVRGALGYLKQCAKADGSFMYSLERNQSQSSYELTAAAVSTLHAAGEYTNDQRRRGVEYLRERVAKHRRQPLAACSHYPCYGNLYAGQVFYQLGGADWEGWAAEAYPDLLDEQDRVEGSWENRYGNEYGTAVSLLILEIPLGYLPIFER